MTIALVGTGQLLEALLAGDLGAGGEPDDFRCSVRRPERGAELKDRYGVPVAASNAAAVADADLVVIGVSPDSLDAVLEEVASALRPDAVVAVATVPATLAELESALPPATPVVRLIPSVNARVGDGVCAVARGTRASDHDVARVLAFVERGGLAVETDEAGLDPVGSLAGSGPAYVAALAQAMVDGGVELGLDADEALRLTIATLRGTAAMLEAGESTVAVQRAVGHPGGSTVRSLDHLRDTGALAAVTAAVTHAFESGAS